MPHPRRFALLLLSLSFLIAEPAVAQPTPSLDIQRFTPSGSYHGFVAVPTAQLLPVKKFGFDAFLDVGVRPLQLSSTDLVRRDGAVDALIALHGRVGFAFAEWVEMDLTWALMQFAVSADALGTLGGEPAEVFSFGDIMIDGRFKPLFEERHYVSVVVRPFVTFPTGNPKLFLTSGVPTFGVDATVSRSIWRFNLAGHLGVKLKFGGPAFIGANVSSEHELMYGLGVGFAVIPDLLDVNAELHGIGMVGPGLGDIGEYVGRGAVHSPLELLFDARIKTKKNFDIVAGLGPGLTPGVGTPVLRFIAGVSYAPSRDRDRDGIADTQDGCPDDPEDIDEFEDGDGCPDRDNDADGILDVDDACPLQAEDVDGFQDPDGCPEPDNDNDGVLDLSDACPDDPEDVDTFEDEDGCPDPDNDQDGVVDRNDLCPLDAEDIDAFEDQDGCPDPDNDGDGFSDEDDICPDEPENVNGVKDDDGCPDDTVAVVRKGKIVILDKVLFKTATDVILSKSRPILDAVKKRLEENPQITKVRIEGHTDNRGDDAYNQRLSEKRAAAILRYLVKAGIDSSRLEAVGYGELRPIDTNKTDAGRERNRRVEFTILEQSDAVETKVVDPSSKKKLAPTRGSEPPKLDKP